MAVPVGIAVAYAVTGHVCAALRAEVMRKILIDAGLNVPERLRRLDTRAAPS